MTDLDRATRGAYEAAAAAWTSGPEHVYGPLASALLDASPLPLRAAFLVDIGSGGGVLGDVAIRRGARCVETDVAIRMLAQRRNRARQAVAADGRHLPFRDATFDVATSACSLSHIADPAHMLAEVRRVLRPDGVLLASTFQRAARPHPVREVVETTLAAAGYEPPGWYERLKTTGERQVETPQALCALASEAGFSTADVVETRIDTGIDAPEPLVDWRLGMAQHADFLASLDDDIRRSVRQAALAQLGHAPPRLVVELNLLVAGVSVR